MNEPVEVDYEALPDNSPLLAQLAAGAFAGIMEHTVMFPIDSIKTRMQTQKISATEGIISSFSRISASEGGMALWRGVSSVVMGAGPAHAIYYLVFESTKTTLCNRWYNLDNNIVTSEKFPLIASISGVAATITSDALMTPFDVLKQRMQNSTHHRSRNLTQFAAHIYKKEGLKSFFVSYPTTLILSIPFAALNFGIYEFSSDALNPTQNYNPLVHCASGGVSGAVAAAVTTPLDCIKTVLQTKSIPGATGMISAAKGLYKQEGISAFGRGLKPRVVLNVPAAAISWTAYEMAKAYML
ncbi:Fe(2+) transporter [Martiniozyma asiatica (nom. inval.)]|nr:Fe(2+) transporter [Martiniozyma asiatica]